MSRMVTGPYGPGHSADIGVTPIPGLGPLESAIMTVAWDAHEPLTGRTVLERLDYSSSTGKAPAYTTITTIMTLLWHKELLARAKRPGRQPRRPPWWYYPSVSREQYLASVIQSVLACAPDPAAVLRLVGADGPAPGSGVLSAPARPSSGVVAGTSPAPGVMTEGTEAEPGPQFPLTGAAPDRPAAANPVGCTEWDSGLAAAALMPLAPLPVEGMEEMLPVRALDTVRTQLAAYGIGTRGLLATRFQATLDLYGGRTITCRDGWLFWPAQNPDGPGGCVWAVHWVGDLAGAIERLTHPGPR
jgi:predicted transcriptional regulator